MNTENPARHIDEAWDGGYAAGLLSARYYALRYAPNDSFFLTPAPTEVPAIVRELLSSMCRGSIDSRLFESSWTSLDHALLCETSSELRTVLAMIPERHFQ